MVTRGAFVLFDSLFASLLPVPRSDVRRFAVPTPQSRLGSGKRSLKHLPSIDRSGVITRDARKKIEFNPSVFLIRISAHRSSGLNRLVDDLQLIESLLHGYL